MRKSEVIHIRAPETLIGALEQYAEATERSTTGAVRSLIKLGLRAEGFWPLEQPRAAAALEHAHDLGAQ